MKQTRIAWVIAAMSFIGLASAVQAAGNTDLGKRDYDSNCASCHGMKGKGDGPYAGIIDTKVSDLTTLAKRNGGVFPVARVHEIIDGRQAVKAHGTRDMPIWGSDYVSKASENYQYDGAWDPESYVRARIVAVSDYIYRFQAK